MFRLGLCASLAAALSLQARVSAATDQTEPNAVTPVASGTAKDSPTVEAEPPGEEGRWFGGLSVFPFTTDQTFGAGLTAGWTRELYALTFRESFLTSANQRVSDTVLERVERRFSFELTAEALLRWRTMVIYAGVGGGYRDDKLTQLQLLNGRFSEHSRDRSRFAPVFVLGLVGKVFEANLSVFWDDEPDIRMGLGVVLGR